MTEQPTLAALMADRQERTVTQLPCAAYSGDMLVPLAAFRAEQAAFNAAVALLRECREALCVWRAVVPTGDLRRSLNKLLVRLAEPEETPDA